MSTLMEVIRTVAWEFIVLIITVATVLVWAVGRRFISLLFNVEKAEAKTKE